MPDKFVYLKRAVPMVHDQISSEAMREQLASTHRSIGAYYPIKGSQRLGSGLTTQEEKLLLSEYLGIDKNDPKLSETIKTFYSDITTKVPGEAKGLELNIGLEDNAKPFGPDNMPVKLHDYIVYRHALGYPNTAPTASSAKGNPLVEYYIEDPDLVLKDKTQEADVRDDAYAEYLKVKKDNDKVNMLLTVLKPYIKKERGVPPINVYELENEKFLQKKLLLLQELAKMRPERFYAAATDPMLKKRYLVEKLISTDIIVRKGNSFVDTTDSDNVLGTTNDEVVTVVFDAKNAALLQRLRAEFDARMMKRNLTTA